MDETIVFFGSGPVAKASLEFILKYFEVEAIVTKPATKTEMSSIAPHTAVYAVQNKAELDELFAKQSFHSRLAVLVDFGVIISGNVIDAFPLGIVNSHFSLLPKLRGADPITFAILEGHEKTGVSLMLIDEKMDTGKLLTQKTLHIRPDATTPSLTKDLVELSNILLADYLPRYVSGEIKARKQPHTDRATYTHKLTKEDGIINWNKSAGQIEREIRAFTGWPGSPTTLAGKNVLITQAHVIPVNHQGSKPGDTDVVTGAGSIMVETSQGSLCIERLKPAGKKDMSAAEFIRGYFR